MAIKNLPKELENIPIPEKDDWDLPSRLSALTIPDITSYQVDFGQLPEESNNNNNNYNTQHPSPKKRSAYERLFAKINQSSLFKPKDSEKEEQRKLLSKELTSWIEENGFPNDDWPEVNDDLTGMLLGICRPVDDPTLQQTALFNTWIKEQLTQAFHKNHYERFNANSGHNKLTKEINKHFKKKYYGWCGQTSLNELYYANPFNVGQGLVSDFPKPLTIGDNKCVPNERDFADLVAKLIEHIRLLVFEQKIKTSEAKNCTKYYYATALNPESRKEEIEVLHLQYPELRALPFISPGMGFEPALRMIVEGLFFEILDPTVKKTKYALSLDESVGKEVTVTALSDENCGVLVIHKRAYYLTYQKNHQYAPEEYARFEVIWSVCIDMNTIESKDVEGELVIRNFQFAKSKGAKSLAKKLNKIFKGERVK